MEEFLKINKKSCSFDVECDIAYVGEFFVVEKYLSIQISDIKCKTMPSFVEGFISV